MREFADDNIKFDENGRKLSKSVENTVGKGEIACHEQFLLFPQYFQNACFPGASKGVIVWEWVKLAGSKDFQKKALILLDECFPKGTRPALISTSNQFKQIERVSKQRLLSSNFGRLLELMPVFLCGIRYDFICLTDLSTSRNSISLPVTSGKFDGGLINKHWNTDKM